MIRNKQFLETHFNLAAVISKILHFQNPYVKLIYEDSFIHSIVFVLCYVGIYDAHRGFILQ